MQYFEQKMSGDLITADQQDLRTDAVVVQDLATQWIQFYP